MAADAGTARTSSEGGSQADHLSVGYAQGRQTCPENDSSRLSHTGLALGRMAFRRLVLSVRAALPTGGALIGDADSASQARNNTRTGRA